MKKSDYTECYINPFNKDRRADKYLKALKGLGGVDYKAIFQYIVGVYDKNSPFADISDIIERKMRSGKLVGFIIEEDEFVAEYAQIMVGADELVNKIAVEYMMASGGIDFAILNTMKQVAANMMIEANEKQKDTKDAALKADLLDKLP